MNFNKAMIDLVKEIRRRAPSDVKPGIKLANPELFDDLIKLYKKEGDVVSNALIKELFELAGGPWTSRLLNNEQSNERIVTQVYRGLIQHVETNDSVLIKRDPQKSKQKIYRGQVVTS
jgi:hypothetical protein